MPTPESSKNYTGKANSWIAQQRFMQLELCALLVGAIYLAVSTSHTIFGLYPVICSNQGAGMFTASCAENRIGSELVGVALTLMCTWVLLVATLEYLGGLNKWSRGAHLLAGLAVVSIAGLSVWLAPVVLTASRISSPNSIGAVIAVISILAAPIIILAALANRIRLKKRAS